MRERERMRHLRTCLNTGSYFIRSGRWRSACLYLNTGKVSDVILSLDNLDTAEIICPSPSALLFKSLAHVHCGWACRFKQFARILTFDFKISSRLKFLFKYAFYLKGLYNYYIKYYKIMIDLLVLTRISLLVPVLHLVKMAGLFKFYAQCASINDCGWSWCVESETINTCSYNWWYFIILKQQYSSL